MNNTTMDTLRSLSPSEFPPLLREIPGQPKQLYVRGELPPYDMHWLAVVGSRALTSYGRSVCQHLIEGLRGYPIVIVSGLAYGADAEAHKTALKVGLPTVAVPGSGLDWDVLYPRANVGLAKEILKAGGALISEELPGARPMEYMFPKRNRVMAGMCTATLIIEAKEKSGSLITARLAADFNRDVLVVPGSIFSAESKGTHQFLRLGATAITSPGDILQVLGITTRDTSQTLRTDVSDEEMRVLAAIAAPLSRDELIRELDMEIQEANILLSTMEIKGLILEEVGVVRAR
jgi:DNA processing protein